MKQYRGEVIRFQSQLRGYIEEAQLPSAVVAAGLAEFLLHYSISEAGITFAQLLLDQLTSRLHLVQEVAALVSSEESVTVS